MSPARRAGAAAAGALAALACLRLLRPRHRRWGASAEECRRALPGDGLVADAAFVATRAITIAAPPAAVWPWLVQQGYGRAGWYSYRVDNAMRRSPDRIVPELQRLAVGDVLKTDARGGFRVVELAPEHHLVLLIESGDGAISAVQVLEPLTDGRTRLIQRVRARFAPTLRARLFALAFDPGDFLMMRAQLRGIRRRAERGAEQPRATRALR